MIQQHPTSPEYPRIAHADVADDALVHVDQIDDCAVVTAGGQIDEKSLPDLLEAIDVAAVVTRRVVIDLTRVTFLDRAGLDALNGVLAWARGSDESVSLVGPAGVVQTAFQGAAEDATFSVPDHVDDAEVAMTHPATYLP